MLTFKIGKLYVDIDFMFVAIVTLFLLTDQSGISIIALLACFIHELGHFIAFFIVGYTPKRLKFEMIGIRLVKPEQVLSIKKEVFVLLSGSMTNLILFFALCNKLDTVSKASIFAVTHLLIGVFNLLPLKSFDGGKILELILGQFFHYETTEKICSVIDFSCLLVMLIVSIYLLLSSAHSLTLFIITVYLMIAAVIKSIKT